MSNVGSIEDRLAIRELIESYSNAVMVSDIDLYRSLWRPDAIWNTGELGQNIGLDNIVAAAQEAMENLSFVTFFASLDSLAIDGDVAHGRWYVHEYMRPKDGARFNVKDGATVNSIGQYDDDYVKVDGRWYFQQRTHMHRNMEPA